MASVLCSNSHRTIEIGDWEELVLDAILIEGDPSAVPRQWILEVDYSGAGLAWRPMSPEGGGSLPRDVLEHEGTEPRLPWSPGWPSARRRFRAIAPLEGDVPALVRGRIVGGGLTELSSNHTNAIVLAELPGSHSRPFLHEIRQGKRVGSTVQIGEAFELVFSFTPNVGAVDEEGLALAMFNRPAQCFEFAIPPQTVANQPLNVLDNDVWREWNTRQFYKLPLIANELGTYGIVVHFNVDGSATNRYRPIRVLIQAVTKILEADRRIEKPAAFLSSSHFVTELARAETPRRVIVESPGSIELAARGWETGFLTSIEEMPELEVGELLQVVTEDLPNTGSWYRVAEVHPDHPNWLWARYEHMEFASEHMGLEAENVSAFFPITDPFVIDATFTPAGGPGRTVRGELRQDYAEELETAGTRPGFRCPHLLVTDAKAGDGLRYGTREYLITELDPDGTGVMRFWLEQTAGAPWAGTGAEELDPFLRPDHWAEEFRRGDPLTPDFSFFGIVDSDSLEQLDQIGQRIGAVGKWADLSQLAAGDRLYLRVRGQPWSVHSELELIRTEPDGLGMGTAVLELISGEVPR